MDDNLTLLGIVRNLDFLFFPVAAAARQAVAAANAKGYKVAVFETWRSPQRQAHLFNQGRTEPGKVITNADAWQSWHQFGLAFDIAFLDDVGWHWNGDFKAVAPFFTDRGLKWLGKADAGHFELTGGLDIRMAKRLMDACGLQRVWMAAQHGL